MSVDTTNAAAAATTATTATTTSTTSKDDNKKNKKQNCFDNIQDIIGTDAGNRGMKSLIVPGDLEKAAEILGTLHHGPGSGPPPDYSSLLKLSSSSWSSPPPTLSKVVLILSGFPCCINETPPTETDGPPGTFAIARAAYAMGHQVIVVTDDCNKDVFAAALKGLSLPPPPREKVIPYWAAEKPMESSNNRKRRKYDDNDDGSEEEDNNNDDEYKGVISLEIFPATTTGLLFERNDEFRFRKLCVSCDLLISCERAGPAQDGKCYTMRGIDMNGNKERMLVAPLHRFVKEVNINCQYISIGDGGNELGMGKVINKIVNSPKIINGSTIGCVIPADFLISASVSNWGGYALSASAALVRAQEDHRNHHNNDNADDADGAIIDLSVFIKKWINKCVPTRDDEIALLDRCVVAGCRDGVSGKKERTVDGMPLETSMQCLRDIRNAGVVVSNPIQ